MLILHVTLRLRAPWCRSLKDKRSVLKGLLAGIRRQFNVSAAESGHQDIHTLIQISVAALAADAAQGDSVAEHLYSFVQGATDAEICDWSAEYR